MSNLDDRSEARPPADQHTPYNNRFQDLNEQFKKSIFQNYRGQYGFFTLRLQKWLRSQNDDGRSNFECMLRHEDIKSPREFVHAKTPILEEGWEYCVDIVFLILCAINQEQHIGKFKISGVSDSSIQKAPLAISDRLEKNTKLSHAALKKLVHDFNEMRWKFCMPRFGIRNIEFDRDAILPFTKMKALKSRGGSADVYSGIVPTEFLEDRLKEETKGTEYELIGDGVGMRVNLILKTFDRNHTNTWSNELNAHEALMKDSDSSSRMFIKYLGAYTQPWNSQDTRNMLFEAGVMDFGEYLREMEPPSRPEEIHDFFSSLLPVLRAVEKLHGYPDAQIRCHADIKPENIFLTDIDKIFVLADLGCTKLYADWKEFHQNDRKGGGTTYSAPEGLKSKDGKDYSKLDIWSLGAVLLVAVTWVLCNKRSVGALQVLCENAVDDAKLPVPNHDCFQQNDKFHNGKGLHDEIRSRWIPYIRGCVRAHDHITLNILDLVMDRMLVNDPARRGDAKGIRESYERVLQDSKARLIPYDDSARVIERAYERAVDTGPETTFESGDAQEVVVSGEGALSENETVYQTRRRVKRNNQRRSVTARGLARVHSQETPPVPMILLPQNSSRARTILRDSRYNRRRVVMETSQPSLAGNLSRDMSYVPLTPEKPNVLIFEPQAPTVDSSPEKTIEKDSSASCSDSSKMSPSLSHQSTFQVIGHNRGASQDSYLSSGSGLNIRTPTGTIPGFPDSIPEMDALRMIVGPDEMAAPQRPRIVTSSPELGQETGYVTALPLISRSQSTKSKELQSDDLDSNFNIAGGLSGASISPNSGNTELLPRMGPYPPLMGGGPGLPKSPRVGDQHSTRAPASSGDVSGSTSPRGSYQKSGSRTPEPHPMPTRRTVELPPRSESRISNFVDRRWSSGFNRIKGIFQEFRGAVRLSRSASVSR